MPGDSTMAALSSGEAKILESLLSTPFLLFADKMRQMVFVDFNEKTKTASHSIIRQ